jgi:8-oxo-dGTP pyrophosphatase MutT (NUDIX family)
LLFAATADARAANADAHYEVGDPVALDEALHTIALSHNSSVVLHHADLRRLWTWFTARYGFVHAAGGAVSDERDRLLVMHRRGMWDLPKGKVDKDEASADAAVREVMEECGLKRVKIVPTGSTGQDPLTETWHTYDHKGGHFLKCTDWYLMRSSSTEKLVAQTEEDISEVRWMDAAELEALRNGFYPTLLAVLDAWRKATVVR